MDSVTEPALAPQGGEKGKEAGAGLSPPSYLYSDRQRWAFLAILFLVCTSSYIDKQLVSILIEPIKKEFGASDTQMGLLTGLAFALFYATLGIPIARLADRGDRKLVLSVSLALWSVATALCGLALNFWQMFAARILVGVGEAGAIPPAQSLIADYFAPEKRTRALAILMSSATIGYLVAFVIGAQVAAQWGWRATFFVMGVPGLLIAAIAWVGLREPRMLPGRQPSRKEEERLTTTVSILFRKRSYVLLTIGTISYFIASCGTFLWFPAYLQRVLGVDLAKIGTTYGLLSAGATFAGMLAGGWISDRMVKRGIKWAARVPAIALFICVPFTFAALTAGSYTGFLIFCFPAALAFAAPVPGMFSLIHLVCGARRRAMAVAINLLCGNLIGLGFGPLLTGYLSDTFTARHGVVGLRYAMLVALLTLLVASIAYWRLARHLEADMEA